MIIESARMYDEVADDFDQAVPFYAAFGRLVIDALKPARGVLLLDVAAGRGAIAGPALERNCVVTAVDAAPAMVAHLQRDLPEADVRFMDAHSLTFLDASFDIVTAGFVVNLLEDPGRFLAEAHRVLTRGGTVAFTLPAQGADVGDWAFCNRMYAEFAAYRPRDGIIVARRLDATRLVTDAGFTDVGSQPLTVRIRVPNSSAAWEFLNTNGTGHFIDTLPPERCKQFRERLDDEFERRGGSVTLVQTADLWTGRRP